MDIRDQLRGITCPMITPFADGTVDTGAVTDLIDHLEAGSIDALFPAGTTGEFASLSPDERRLLVEHTVERASVPVVAGASATDVESAVEAIDVASAAGADAAVLTPPYFHTANAPQGNQRFFETVADRSSLPLLLYNIPACTGREIAPETVVSLADHDRILGLKDSSGDLEYFLTVLDRTPEEFLMLQGYDSLLVPAMRMGADGGVNALSNVLPNVYDSALTRKHDERGRALQKNAISPLFESCKEFGFAPATKTALSYRGVIQSDRVRPPLVAVEDDGTRRIVTSVDQALEEFSD
ncbi:dihydrodipicolinate synthase family protein [Halostagnicola sp. A-GB9-2]|uniref:dihydrodipicolinate synthase family protein n=1 Tax=Halostagnicola sp. A-GB9-2 TaxID=3048066 RepID=UPI0024BF1D82|nr:dihydrodipicolinate synthase family protein [Halostagnicola sp. A-GB9-2]MDJ1431519.1 dihydrodipicolinate synthase family protein [Halostagnicola sp. A-GB9-2]